MEIAAGLEAAGAGAMCIGPEDVGQPVQLEAFHHDGAPLRGKDPSIGVDHDATGLRYEAAAQPVVIFRLTNGAGDRRRNAGYFALPRDPDVVMRMRAGQYAS